MVFFFGNARTAILDVFILFCIRTLGVISWYGGHFRLNLGIIILLTALLPKNIFISQSSSPPKSINLVVYLHWSVITVQGVWVASSLCHLMGKKIGQAVAGVGHTIVSSEELFFSIITLMGILCCM